MTRLPLAAALAATLVAGCHAPAVPTAASAPPPPLFETFGDLHRDIGTPSPAAQRYFDQGLRMMYGFNHEAAGRAFAEAARLDPDCAMCAWGQALVLGPNINLPMDPATATAATAAARHAVALERHARPADRALIDALAARYAVPAPADRKPLDRAYAAAMANVAARFPEDDDVAALYAESLMDLTPWAYWTAEGQQTEFTPRILGALQRVLARNPRHIGAMHYYIHATEASQSPERALIYADALAALAPGSGHLVHMPAHTYIRVGRYHDATLTNLAASTADKMFLSACHGSNGAYPLGYVPHNWHFATMSASLTGSRVLAMQAAEETAKRADRTQLDNFAAMQQFLVMPLFTRVRFGDWDGILATPAPDARPYPQAIWHFARGMAFATRHDLSAAKTELAGLRASASTPGVADLAIGNNPAGKVLAVAAPMLEAEIARAQGRTALQLDRLRVAAKAEDAMAYDEPANWPLPVRPYLGAALLAAHQAGQAKTVYLQDLRTLPDNGWSLFGMAQAQRALGDAKGAADSERRYKSAWQWADAPLTASRY